MQALFNLLNLIRLPSVVDVGANPIDGDPPYKELLDAGLCHVIGFEPQSDALKLLQSNKGNNETYLPYVVGDGSMHTLHFCRASGMTSLFKPDVAVLDIFQSLKPSGEVLRTEVIQTTRLDQIAEVVDIDFLKIDVQGAELMVFQGGREKLRNAVAIQTEVSFMTLYEGQPTFGSVDLELRQQGFVPHCFASIKQWPISPCVVGGDPRRPLNQLLEADMVYIRDISRPNLISIEQLKHLALIAHVCYKSWDLAMRCIWLLERRGGLPTGSEARYVAQFGQQPSR